jgi:16S rRNA (cytosine1402-N4)-methyltransferase
LTKFQHIPVLLGEVVEFLSPKFSDSEKISAKPEYKKQKKSVPEIKSFDGNFYVVDGTFGGGGHAEKLIESLLSFEKIKTIHYLAIDQDQWAHDNLPKLHWLSKLTEEGDKLKFSIQKTNFEAIQVVAEQKLSKHIIFADLGVSSPQLDSPERGFSIKHDGPIDMRMDTSSTTTALDILIHSTQQELQNIFFNFGEEPKSKKLAEQIVTDRKTKPEIFKSTAIFAEYVKKILNYHGSKTHPATRIFQALRIATNNELEVANNFLQKSLELLTPGGKIGIISFHSLEDRIVKSSFRQWESLGLGFELPRGGVIAQNTEQQQNPRSRSARLRVFCKTS